MSVYTNPKWVNNKSNILMTKPIGALGTLCVGFFNVQENFILSAVLFSGLYDSPTTKRFSPSSVFRLVFPVENMVCFESRNLIFKYYINYNLKELNYLVLFVIKITNCK
jgi:hypothetical protein